MHVAYGAPPTSHHAIGAGRCEAGVGLAVLQSANLWGRPVTFFACTFAPGAQAVGTISEFFRKMARPAGFEPATLGLEVRRPSAGEKPLPCGATRSEAVGRREPGTAGVPGDSTRGTDGRTGTDLSAGSHLLHRVPLGWPGVSRARAPPTSPLPSGCWRPGWPNGRATPDRGRSRLTPSPCVVSHIGGRRHRVNVRGALVWAHQRAQSLPPTIAHGETLYPTPMGNPSAR